MAERVKQEKDEQEEEGVKKCERCQAHARIDDDAEDLLGGLRGVLQNVPRVEAYEATDIDAETAQGRNDEDKDPACDPAKSADNNILHQIEGDHTKQGSRP